MNELSLEIGDKIRAAARARVRRHALGASRRPSRPGPWPASFSTATEKLICVGSSTGGTEALKECLITHARLLAGHADHPAHARILHGNPSPPASTGFRP
jgi:hypothetical protein